MRKTKFLVSAAIGAALLAAGAMLSIPGPVPFTMQTLAVLTVAGLLGGKTGCASVAVYLLLGAMGAPVFSGFRGGVHVLLGATGGYLWGFLPAAWIVGFGVRRWKRTGPRALVMASGLLVVYAVGTAWYAALYGGSVGSILLTCVVPFVVPDALKAALSLLLIRRVAAFLDKTDSHGILIS